MKYLIMQCRPLNDAFECDADRIPICIVDNYRTFKAPYRWEAYLITPDGKIRQCVKEWEN